MSRVHRTIAAAEPLEHRLVLSAPLPSASVATSFYAGPMISDRQQNLVYVAASDKRILAVDTDLGRTVATVRLQNSAHGFAISPDGKRLFALEYLLVDVFELPTLKWVSKFSLPPMDIESIAVGANNRLYASSMSGKLLQFDATTGAQTSSIDARVPFGRNLFEGEKIVANAAGTRLFVKTERTVPPVGRDGIDEYDISQVGVPKFLRTFVNTSRAGAMLVDETRNRLYIGSTAKQYSTERAFLQRLDLDTAVNAQWPATDTSDHDVTVIVGAHPAADNVFSLAYTRPYVDTAVRIRQFDAGSGSILGEYVFSDTELGRAAVTPNGRLLYSVRSENALQSYLSIIGASSLKIESKPPVAKFATTPYSSQTFLFDGSSSKPNSSFDNITRAVWHFGDGTTASRLVSMHTYAQPGSYRARLTLTDADGDVGEYVATVVAGNTAGTASLNGRVFLDVNRNGVRDSGERGLKDRYVWIDVNNNRTWDGLDRTGFTGNDGSFDILRLAAGTYHLHVQASSDELQIRPIHEWKITLPGGERITGRNFALAIAASITGKVVFDPNGDGDTYSSIPVYRRHVWLDSNNNSRIDAHEPLTRTNYTGSYTFGHLLPGTYRLRAELAPGESLLASSGLPKVVSIDGYYGVVADEVKIVPIPSASVTGIVFDDRNVDGKQDASERGAKGVGVYILTRGGKRTAVSDANGAFAFTGLLQDHYNLQVVAPRGWRSVNEYGTSISTTLNSVLGDVRVAITSMPLLSGRVVLDANKDGVLDEDPTYGYGTSDWTVFADFNRNGLLDSDEPSDVTSSGGYFNLLLPARGTYDIRLVARSYYVITKELLSLSVAPGEMKTVKLGVQWSR